MTDNDLKNYVPKYLDAFSSVLPRSVVTSDRWNELWRLTTEQGNYNAVTLVTLLTKLTTELWSAGASSYIAAPQIHASAGLTITSQLAWLKAYADANKALIDTNETDIENKVATHKTSADHDGRYYTETEVNAIRDALQAQINTNETDIETKVSNHKTGSDHDSRYYTETEVNTIQGALQAQINTNAAGIVTINNLIAALNNTYSTDLERINAINQVVNDFQAADSNLTTLLGSKANSADVYTKAQIDAMSLGPYKFGYLEQHGTFGADTAELAVTITEWDPTNDALTLYINGLFQTYGPDFTMDGTSRKLYNATEDWTTGMTYDIYIIKRVRLVAPEDYLDGAMLTEGSVTKAAFTDEIQEDLFGIDTTATGMGAHAEGIGTIASNTSCHAEGSYATAAGITSHAEGAGTQANGDRSHAEGWETITSEEEAHAEGKVTKANGRFSHAEGQYTVASGDDAHAEGNGCDAVTTDSHAEGYYTNAVNGTLYKVSTVNNAAKTVTVTSVSGLSVGDHVTVIRNNGDKAAVVNVPISYINSLTLTLTTTDDISGASWVVKKPAMEWSTHSEGSYTVAVGADSHAEGNSTVAEGDKAHAQNYYTHAKGYAQTVIGMYNVLQGSPTGYTGTDNAFVIGNGTSDGARSNALEVNWNGVLSTVRAGIMGGIPEGLGPYYTDFLANTSFIDIWAPTAVSSGTKTTAVVANHPGIIVLNSSTSSNSGYRLMTDIGMILTPGMASEFIFKVDTTTNTLIRLGFHDSTSVAAPVDGVWIDINGTTLSGKAASNSVGAASTTYTITAGTWYRAKIEVLSSTAAAYFLYSEAGALLWSGTVSGSIPYAAGRDTFHGAIATNAGNSAVALVSLDFMNLYSTKKLSR